MKSAVLFLMTIIGVLSLNSCSSATEKGDNSPLSSSDKVVQAQDGTISLNVDKADCYHDLSNPAYNSAEWSVVVSKSGRFNIWLSSATKDTTNLDYHSDVMLSIRDNQITKTPRCDKVIQNSGEVSYPYFRADSFMGSMYLQDTGVYNIQIISDKIIPKSNSGLAASDNSKLISVILLPATR